MGVIAANGHGLDAFEDALRRGVSGIRVIPKLVELGFGCHLAGVPQGVDELKARYFTQEELFAMNSSMIFSCIAGIDAWTDAGLEISGMNGPTDWESGAIIGSGTGGTDNLSELVRKTDTGQVRRLGSTTVEQTMASSVSARLGGCLGLGGQVTTNSSACSTGTEAIVNAYWQVREGRATRMLAGGSESASYYIWAGFDAMRVLARDSNHAPERASRPMSASASGFVPSAGAGVLLLESLSSARKRGARIHGEVLAGAVNSGGQRGGGSMTAPNSEGVVRCIRSAILTADIQPSEIDAINGHLTATMADPIEVANWARALERAPGRLPWLQSTKSLIGHSLGGAGGIECVASVLQLSRGFLHGSSNCEDLHPSLEPYAGNVLHETRNLDVRVIAKASFGFGDVNACVIFRRWEP